MKRYALFAGETYYPAGGWSDFIGSFDSFSAADEVAQKENRDWSHVIDLDTGEWLYTSPPQ
jgi:hypothetical protein